MKDKSRPIIIDGVTYYVDRTLDGSPAAYECMKSNYVHHINDVDAVTTIDSLLDGNNDGVIIIVARKGETVIQEDNKNE